MPLRRLARDGRRKSRGELEEMLRYFLDVQAVAPMPGSLTPKSVIGGGSRDGPSVSPGGVFPFW